MQISEHLVSLRQQVYNSEITYIQLVHEELMILRVRPDFSIPPHKAGQYTTLGLGYWEPRCEGCQEEHLKPGQETKLVKRAYSLSCPLLGSDGELLRREDEDFLEFYIVLVRQAEKPPALTPRIFCLKEGDRIFVGKKITGRYTLDAVQPGQTILFMATGTGEAPHNKMFLELIRRGHEGPIASIVCVRYQLDLAYLETQRQLSERMPNYHYMTLTTREPSNQGKKIYIQDLVRTGQLEEELQQPLDPASTHVYLCGNPLMIGVPKRTKEGYSYPQPTGVIEILESRGFKTDRPRDPGNIHFEEYW
ncbi:ferredoxin--NADP reductase [Acidobacteria bacterium AH-259-A15]|nr:ferredoxin--NADP reductase [Acidobacteria bacterium AH-259-A15]